MTDNVMFNADLVSDLARRRVVVFIGAGVSKSAHPNDGSIFEDWEAFLINANKNLSNQDDKNQIEELIKNKEYLFASELLKIQLSDQWDEILQRSFLKKASTSPLHKAIVLLRPRIILTTNFDKLIESAWDENTQEDFRYPKIIRKIDSEIFKLFRDEETYIIKLHGSIDEPKSLIFDKSSYQSSAFGNQYYKELLSALLLTHTFLFIGFSMADPAVSGILELYAHNFSNMRPHYIFQSGDIGHIDSLWKEHRKLSVIRYSSENNHQQLVDFISSLGESAIARRREILSQNQKMPA